MIPKPTEVVLTTVSADLAVTHSWPSALSFRAIGQKV